MAVLVRNARIHSKFHTRKPEWYVHMKLFRPTKVVSPGEILNKILGKRAKSLLM